MTAVHADPEAEQAVLGAAMLLGDARIAGALLARGLRAEHFSEPKCGLVFKAITSLADRQSGIDYMTVWGEVERLGYSSEISRAEVEHLSGFVPVAGNHDQYADRVIELAQWRRWQQAAAEAWAAAERRDHRAFAQAQAMFTSTTAGTRHDTYSPEQWGATLFDYFSAPPEQIAARGVPILFPRLTEASGGGQPGEFWAIGGSTGHGKSTGADQIADDAAALGKRCHIYMTEMTAEARGMRYLARRTGVPFMKQRRNDLTPEQRKLVLEELAHMPYGCSVVADWTIDDVVRDALRARYDLVIVDLLHGFHYEDERGLDRLSKAMQRLARVSTTIDGHPGTVVVAVTHLKEEGMVRGKVPRPTITSIKGGSSIKQDADAVLFIWQDQDEGGLPNGDGEIWLAKGRSMELARVKVRLNPARFRFEIRPDEAEISTAPTEAMAF